MSKNNVKVNISKVEVSDIDEIIGVLERKSSGWKRMEYGNGLTVTPKGIIEIISSEKSVQAITVI